MSLTLTVPGIFIAKKNYHKNTISNNNITKDDKLYTAIHIYYTLCVNISLTIKN